MSGPWSWVRMHDRYTVESADSSVCHVSTEADARLIAAAPDLLKALKIIQRSKIGAAACPDPTCNCHAALACIEALIAKAEGR